MEVSIPEVQAIGQQVEFYKDNGIDYAKISFVGMKDNVIRKVTPEVMGKFKPQWDAYCDGRPLAQREGSPLTEIVPEEKAKQYVQRNVHTVEELAALSDAQCQAIGHGTLTDRTTAIKVLQQRKLDQMEATRKALEKASPTIRPQTEKEQADLKAITDKVDSLADTVSSLAQIVQAMAQAPKRGRPPKAKEPA